MRLEVDLNQVENIKTVSTLASVLQSIENRSLGKGYTKKEFLELVARILSELSNQLGDELNNYEESDTNENLFEKYSFQADEDLKKYIKKCINFDNL
jgi:hypothetical protein